MSQKQIKDISLIPINEFKAKVIQVLRITKLESDKDITEFQAENLRKRQAKKAKP